ncbi:DNA-binding transcriptional repressor AcrR [mine drainage metagenome]|uniref:DNA-binding transcriptional repressor AcrR n=1 Tax=mine drainage metagenome TaxID=410659 RepID=A0A1J5TKW6_9ZZZZ
MGIVERKEKQKQDIKKMILDASMKLFVEEGFDNVTIRKIADLIEYSPTTVYLYFKDKDEVFFHLSQLGFEKMLELNQNLAGISNPLMRLYKMGENYIHFGMTNPEFYDVMFIQRAPMDCISKMEELEWSAGNAAIENLKELLKECMDKGLIQKAPVEVVAMAIWGLVHGMVSLAIRSRLDHINKKVLPKDQLMKMMQQSINWVLGAIDTSVKKK